MLSSLRSVLSFFTGRLEILILTADRLSYPSSLFLFKLFIGAFAVRFGVYITYFWDLTLRGPFGTSVTSTAAFTRFSLLGSLNSAVTSKSSVRFTYPRA